MFQFSLFHPPATNNLSILFATLSFITQIAKPEQAVFDLLFDDTVRHTLTKEFATMLYTL
eukprot:m.106924 g.106924  ORF g.106924 m.106924 type:complete len:60 (-) comp13312_c1_seq5:1576-1755(-)